MLLVATQFLVSSVGWLFQLLMLAVRRINPVVSCCELSSSTTLPNFEYLIARSIVVGVIAIVGSN
jgi:hypothetical protein